LHTLTDTERRPNKDLPCASAAKISPSSLVRGQCGSQGSERRGQPPPDGERPGGGGGRGGGRWGMLAPAESSIHRRRHCYRPFADAQDVGACHGDLYNTGPVHDQPATRESRLSVLRSCVASEHAPLTDPRSHERLSVEPSVWSESERSLTSEMGMVIVTNSDVSDQQRPSSSKPGTGSPTSPFSSLMLGFGLNLARTRSARRGRARARG
jgi:hypothetical protein